MDNHEVVLGLNTADATYNERQLQLENLVELQALQETTT